MQFDSLEIQKIIEEKRLILGSKFKGFLLTKLAKFYNYLASLVSAKYTAFFGIIFIIAVSILAQSTRDLGHDSATYPEIAQKMLNGGEYFSDFFELNLPLNFVLTMIPLLLAQKLDLNIFATSQVFWNLLGILSIYSSAKILSRSELTKDRAVFNIIILGFAAGFFWRALTLEFNEFGTKTTYLLSILFPYISYHLLEQNKLKNFDQIVIGILAGLLFCLKPHYGIFVIVFELSKLIKKRDFFSIFCLRNYITLLLLLGYALALFEFSPDYMGSVLTLSSSYYTISENLTFDVFALDIFVFLLFGILCIDIIKDKKVLQLLFLSVFSAALLILMELIGGLDQRFIIYSVALPTVVLTLLFMIRAGYINWSRDWMLLLAILIVPQFDSQSVFNLIPYFACFWCIFSFFIIKKWQNFIKIHLSLKIILTIAAVATIAMIMTGKFAKIFWTLSLIIFIFHFYLDQRLHEKFLLKGEFSCLSACAIFFTLSYLVSLNLSAVFNFKFHYESYNFSSPNSFNSEVIKVIKYHSKEGETVTFITDAIPGMYPAITYAGKKNELPFLQYTALFKHILEDDLKGNDTANYMISRLKTQLNSKKNKLVLIDIKSYLYRGDCTIGLLEYQFRDPEFRKIFLENYVFLTRVRDLIESSEDPKIINHDAEIYIRR